MRYHEQKCRHINNIPFHLHAVIEGSNAEEYAKEYAEELRKQGYRYHIYNVEWEDFKPITIIRCEIYTNGENFKFTG